MSYDKKNEDELSKIGENFVYENFPLLFGRLPIVKCELNTAIQGKDRSEGADVEAWLLITTKQDGRKWLEEGFEKVIKQVGTGDVYSIDKIVKGPIEVKTAEYNQYVARYDYGFNFDCGVIQFAIWNSSNHEGREEPKRKRLGSLYRMFYPSVAEHERQPLAYAAVFVTKDDDPKPYACLIFENFSELKERLIEIGRKCGLDLTKEGFESIPCWDNLNGWDSPDDWADWKMSEYPELHLKQNMWYIRMSDVIDLATVILIGEPLEINEEVNGCSVALQEKRWNFLKENSQKTIPLVTAEETRNTIQMRREIFETMTKFPWEIDATTGNNEMRIHVRERRET